jgi:hypothetical protein
MDKVLFKKMGYNRSGQYIGKQKHISSGIASTQRWREFNP